MSATPAAATVRSPGWLAAVVGAVGVLGFVYYPVLKYCFKQWQNPDYSHGFLVIPFAGYLAWRFRDRMPTTLRWPDTLGLAAIAVGAGLFVVGAVFNTGKEWIQGASLVINLCGFTLLFGGRAALRWLWPTWVFLVFMFPLPYKVEHALGGDLQRIAAEASTFVLQTVGLPSYREGVTIHVADQQLEVEKACNGLSMLLTFLTLSAAMATLVNRPWLDRVLILLSAVPLAVVANVARISLTGVLYVMVGPGVGKAVFHDFAGWLMMPFALGLIWLELKLLDWVLVSDLSQASREDVIKSSSAHPSYLFMANNPALQPPARGPGR